MKPLLVILGFSLAAVQAFGVKPCGDLKSEIAAKLDAKGVKGYQLEIVATADAKGQTVIGSCEGGTKNITYKRGGQAADKGTATSEKK